MSRSQRAWAEGCTLVGAVVRGTDKWARRANHPSGDRERLLRALLPSFLRPVLVLAAGLLVVGAMPASAIARAGHTARPGLSKAHNNHRRPTTRPGSSAARRMRSRADGRSINVQLDGNMLLAPGAGYDSIGGSAVVRDLQLRLARSGDSPGPIDGRYGPLTEQAVRRFQAAHGLVVDGIAGPVTLAALTSSAPVLYPGTGYGQARGSAIVRSLQGRLAGLGFAPGPADGRYGPLTVHAVERFQRASRLAADGIVGPRTAQAIRVALRRRAAHSKYQRPPKHQRPPQHQRPPKRHPALRRNQAPKPHQPSHAPGPARSTAHPRARVPVLPVTLVLLGMAVLGLGTLAVSYQRTRARARASVKWSDIYGTPPPLPPQRPARRGDAQERTPVGTSAGSDEESNQ